MIKEVKPSQSGNERNSKRFLITHHDAILSAKWRARNIISCSDSTMNSASNSPLEKSIQPTKLEKSSPAGIVVAVLQTELS